MDQKYHNSATLESLMWFHLSYKISPTHTNNFFFFLFATPLSLSLKLKTYLNKNKEIIERLDYVNL